MQIIDINNLKPSSGGAARFQGVNHETSVSFFVVTSAPGKGADKHRHPYEEIFIILDGRIEVIVNGETRMIESGNITIIPAHAWHEFKNRSDHAVLMVNIHPVSQMIQEDWSAP